MLRKANNILELVGQTPIVRLNRLNPHSRVEVYVKLEYFNPGGSDEGPPGPGHDRGGRSLRAN